MMFKKAERKQLKLKIGLSGPSGSGKTFSALRIASALGKKIAVADTENGSAALYGDRFNFDSAELIPPYTTKKYIDAIQFAEENDYDVLIIDSASHQWAGEGGILNQKEQMDSRGGNSFTNWGKLTPEHTKFLSAILHANIHIIVTLRSKSDYIMVENDKGKQAPKKVGLAPIQREGMEYEFTVMLDLAMDHSAQASKDRTGLFDQLTFVPGEETGRMMMEWLSSGKKVWRFGMDEKASLRKAIESNPHGKAIFSDWQKRFGDHMTADEAWYNGILDELTTRTEPPEEAPWLKDESVIQIKK